MLRWRAVRPVQFGFVGRAFEKGLERASFEMGRGQLGDIGGENGTRCRRISAGNEKASQIRADPFSLLVIFSSLSFIVFGWNCLTSKFMIDEFERYRSSKFRKSVGALQLMGGVGLLGGFWIPILGLISAIGLAILMLLAFAIRLRIRDGFFQSAPSIAYTALNAYLCWEFARVVDFPWIVTLI